jgi:cytochrome bd ubiquinol oxidase subunit I
VFNPSFPYRLVHMVLAAYLTTAWSSARWRLASAARPRQCGGAHDVFHGDGHADRRSAAADRCGRLHGLNTLEYQPAKVAAMEGHFEPHPKGGAPLILFGLPDAESETVRYAVQIPYLSSLILTHDLTSPLPGLKDFPREERPPVAIVFWSFRVMVAWALRCWAWASGRRCCAGAGMYDQPWLHRAAVAMGPAGFVAVLAGWITTEVGGNPGRSMVCCPQPTAWPRSRHRPWSIALAFIVIYFTVFGAGTFYILRLMGKRPESGTPMGDLGPTRTAGVTPAPAVDDKFIPAE